MLEIEKLEIMLKVFNIPFEVTRHSTGTDQVWYPNRKNKICDIICFPGSYGYEQGLLEIMGLNNKNEIDDSCEGYLTADQIFDRILDNYITWYSKK